MYYTYILSSIKQPGAIYIGYTSNLKSRLFNHNFDKGRHYSSKYSPWKVETYVGFCCKSDAEAFEQYLKSNSGKAFLRKHLISDEFRVFLKTYNNGRGEKK